MQCKFCGTQNPEQAVFCRNCGKRLDGTMPCPSCGGQISADDTFCIFCGAEINKPDFIVGETAVASAVETADPTVAAGVSQARAQTAKRVLNYIANGAAILTAVLALIFVFLIGTVTSVHVDSSTVTKTNLDINYFFHDGYKQIEAAIKSIKDYNQSLSGSYYNEPLSNYRAYVQYIPLVSGTLILAGTIIAVVALSVTATVRSIQNLLGKSEKSGCGYGVAAFITFAAGAAMLTALCGVSYSGNSLNEINSTTKTGIILLTIFTFIAVACKTATKGRKLLQKSEALKYSFALGGIALLAVVTGVAAMPLIGMSAEGQSASIGVNNMLTVLGLGVLRQSDYESVKNIPAITALAPCVFLVTCLAIIIAAVCIIRHAGNIHSDKDNKCLCLNIILVCVSVILLVLTLIFVDQFKKGIAYLDETDDTKYTYAIPIVTLVFSVLSLIENIVYRVINRPVQTADVE